MSPISSRSVKETRSENLSSQPREGRGRTGWKLVTGPTVMNRVPETPAHRGYYNGEGTNEGQGFLQTKLSGRRALAFLRPAWARLGVSRATSRGLILG